VSIANSLRNLRFALRLLAKERAFTLVAVLTIALGIGANSAIFSVINAVLLRPLPYGEPDRLVKIWEKRPRVPRGRVSWADYADWRDRSRAFEVTAAYATGDYNLTGNGDPEQVQGASISAAAFRVLQVVPEFGRTFSADEDQPGAHRVAILSHGLWERRFGGDPGAIGKPIHIDGAPYEVVGIMPKGFYFPDRQAELWEPLAIDPHSRMAGRGMHRFEAIGRLRPDRSLTQARAEMETIAAHLEKEYPRDNTGHGVNVFSMLDDSTSDYRTGLFAIFGAVVLVLLIACANVANLQLSRAAARQKEIAIRCALGASRQSIAGQLLMESVLVSLLGGSLGLLLARWLIRVIVSVTPPGISRMGESSLELKVLAFTLLMALGTGILFGLAPALHSSRPDLAGALKENPRGATRSRASGRLLGALVMAQVALSLILLAGAGLLMKSFVLLERVNPGFRAAQVLTGEISLPAAKYRPAQREAFVEHVLDRVRADGMVQAAGAVTHLPLAGNGPTFDLEIAGRPLTAPGEEAKAQMRCATPDYFRTLGIPLLAGRPIESRDSADAPGVLVVNDVMAQRYWPGQSPLGQRITFDKNRDGTPVWREIVGVVQGVRHGSLESEPEPQMYTPFAQFSMPFVTVVVRTSAEPLGFSQSLRSAVTSVDSTQAVSKIRSMEQVVEQSVASRRFNLLLLGFFALIALLMASIGIYGVLTYTVSQRQEEIAIRVALGATANNVLWLVIKQGMLLASGGVFLGVLGALAVTRLLGTLLYQVGTLDPLVFGSVVIVLLAVAALASYLPAARATTAGSASA
jgi:putative ABC transport system permease protein